MNASYGLNAYQSHDLSISMKTSSGDVISMDFSNAQELSMAGSKNENGSSSSLSFSSMQSFQYSVETNGIDAQDQKEIDAFMEIAQPYIDDYLSQLEEDMPTSPVNQIASQVANIFSPAKEKDENTQNYAKSNIVNMFDNSMDKFEKSMQKLDEDKQNTVDKVFRDAQHLLEKTIKAFDDIGKYLYA